VVERRRKGRGERSVLFFFLRGRLLKWKRTIRLVKDRGHYRSETIQCQLRRSTWQGMVGEGKEWERGMKKHELNQFSNELTVKLYWFLP
jgi:hypothetical protein